MMPSWLLKCSIAMNSKYINL